MVVFSLIRKLISLFEDIRSYIGIVINVFFFSFHYCLAIIIRGKIGSKRNKTQVIAGYRGFISNSSYNSGKKH